MKPGTVILDVDGTLVDSNDAPARAWVDAFAENGITASLDEVRRAIGMGGDKLMPVLSGSQENSDRGKRIGTRHGEIFMARNLPTIRTFAGTREPVDLLMNDEESPFARLRDGHHVSV